MIKDLYRKGVSISDIARQTGHDRKTIRRIIAEPVRTTRRRSPAQKRATKLDPYHAYLQERLADGVFNAHKLFLELQQRGYAGGETMVRAYVAPFRVEARKQATMRFETAPGEQAQVDWGHFGWIDHYGRRRRLYAFVMTLGWSRMSYLEFTVSADTAWYIRCHLHAFAYFGGLPQHILHDNLKSVVLDRDPDGTIRWNPRYLEFAATFGFTPRACAPYRPQTKGKVENGVKYVRGNFWQGLKYTDLGDLNRQARHWLDTVANCRIHGTTGDQPFARLAQEQLRPTPDSLHYDTSVICLRHVTRDCLVSYEGNFYSVPALHVGRQLVVKETEQGELLVATAQGEIVARHPLVQGRRQRIIRPEHYAGLSGSATPPTPAGGRQVPQRSDDRWNAPEVELRPLSIYDAVLVEAIHG